MLGQINSFYKKKNEIWKKLVYGKNKKMILKKDKKKLIIIIIILIKYELVLIKFSLN